MAEKEIVSEREGNAGGTRRSGTEQKRIGKTRGLRLHGVAEPQSEPAAIPSSRRKYSWSDGVVMIRNSLIPANISVDKG